MVLWIRSQDKRHLIKADYVSIMENNIINVASSGWDYDVAKYKSKERALEVLDEIEKIIQPPMNFIVSQHIDFDNDGEGLIGYNILKEEPKIERISDIIVYEMPKE